MTLLSSRMNISPQALPNVRRMVLAGHLHVVEGVPNLHLCTNLRSFQLLHLEKFSLAHVGLASRPGVRMAVFANCCFGGRRQKWTAVLTNS